MLLIYVILFMLVILIIFIYIPLSSPHLLFGEILRLLRQRQVFEHFFLHIVSQSMFLNKFFWLGGEGDCWRSCLFSSVVFEHFTFTLNIAIARQRTGGIWAKCNAFLKAVCFADF